MTRIIALAIIYFTILSCVPERETVPSSPYLLILGVAQDAGYPQAGCYAPHCMRAWNNISLKRSATSFALIDPQSKQKWLFEATPNIKEQLFNLEKHAPDSIYSLAGVFLTHGHMGHYTGLIHFGRESMGANQLPVYAMPRMKEYLTENGPWSQLVKLNNIVLHDLADSVVTDLTPGISVLPFSVPHRDEFTETVGYKVTTKNKNVVFIPDIDKWSKWTRKIEDIVPTCDIALLDATFFDSKELPGRDMKEIPHPFVQESMRLFSQMDILDRNRIYFIHFNHSNSLLIDDSSAKLKVEKEGYHIAKEGEIIAL